MTDQLTELLESLRRGEPCVPTFEQIEALIAWLNGSSRQAQAQESAAGYDPILVLLVLQQLERSLFKHDHLDIKAAGLGPEQPRDLRRMRFRRLASVFHPDRFPDLADWLTVRSQAIHRAYTHFKQQPDAWPGHKRPNPTGATTEAVKPATVSPVRPPRREAPIHDWLIALRARFGHDRRLAHKLIALLALIAALPVANLYLAQAIPYSASASIASKPAYRPVDSPTISTAETASVDTGIESALPAVDALASDNDQAPAQPIALKTQQAITNPEPVASDETTAVEEPVLGPSVDEPLLALGSQDDRQAVDRLAPEGDVAVQAHHDAQPLHSAASKEPTPVFIAGATKAEFESVYPQTANAAFKQDLQNHIQYNNYELSAAHSQGELVLGPLKRHPVGHLLAAYQSHVQSGNVNALMQLFTSARPKQGRRNGSAAISEYYRTLFSRSSQRTLHLRVLRMQRDGDGWQVETALDFSITSDDGEEQIMYGRTHFRIQPDRGVLRIVAMEN